jgi:hypothetical protein
MFHCLQNARRCMALLKACHHDTIGLPSMESAMSRIHFASLLTLLLITPALAQVVNIPPAPLPKPELPGPPRMPQKSIPTVDAAEDPERARKLIAELRAKNRELDVKLQQSLSQLDEITKRGGSLVRAYCRDDRLSVNSAGASENCAASGYACAPVEGLCYRRCNVTIQCASGFVCDTGRQACVKP